MPTDPGPDAMTCVWQPPALFPAGVRCHPEGRWGWPAWQKANRGWQARAARGPGVSGGPKGTRTAYFYGGGFFPFGRSWGGSFAPTRRCPIAPPPPTICVSLDPLMPCPSIPPAATPAPGLLNPQPTHKPKG